MGSARQCCAQFIAQPGKIALNPAVTADQHMIVCGQPKLREQFAQQCAKAALHPVANHRIADFSGDGDSEAYLIVRIGVNQQHKTGTRHAQAPVCR